METSKWQSPTIGLAIALYAVWMQRHGRWALFFGALTGKYHLAGTRSGTGPGIPLVPRTQPPGGGGGQTPQPTPAGPGTLGPGGVSPGEIGPGGGIPELPPVAV